MGFQEMEKFNITMLGKMGWQLIHHPDTLYARLIKGIYYTSSYFMNARLGNKPRRFRIVCSK